MCFIRSNPKSICNAASIMMLLLWHASVQNTPNDSAKLIKIEGAIVKVAESSNVPAEITGVISEIAFREGQRVNKGDLLVTIKSNDLRLQLKQAEGRHRIATSKAENSIDIEYARKSAEVSSAKLARSLNSNQRAPGVVPSGRIQELELEAKRDRLRVDQANRDIEVAKMEQELSHTGVELSKGAIAKSKIVAPISGVVVLVDKSAGEWVEPGETVMKIVQLDRLRVEGFVSASEVGRISIGDSASVVFAYDWLENKEISGEVVFVNPEANPVNSQVEVWIEIDNPSQKLIPGLEASVSIGSSSD